MSPDFPRRPKTAKGAIMALKPDSKNIIIDPNIPTLIFQYNPETLTHTLSSADSEETLQKGEKLEAKPVSKPIKERKSNDSSIIELITLTLEFDAAHQLEEPEKNRNVVENGLHPALAVLESIMTSQFKTRSTITPVLVFLFGRNRSVPVWLQSLKIIEEAFDPNLNPIRVKIELLMRVRSLSEFKKGSIGHALCANHLEHRRTLSKLHPHNGSMPELIAQVMRSIH